LILSSNWNTITLRRSKSVLNRQPDFKLFRWAAGAMHNKALHQSDGGLANFGNRRSSRRLVNADVRQESRTRTQCNGTRTRTRKKRDGRTNLRP
jgi:hypothetical protein